MDKRINCQLINILLNENNEFANKYCTVFSGNYEYDSLIEDYFVNKNMRSIKIDRNNQSVCFTNQKEMISFYNQSTRQNDQYYEEIHLHCNDLSNFDRFLEYLYKSEYYDIIDEVDAIPHYEIISKGKFKDYELIMEPMTNEVMTTRNLLNILSQKSDETIFRALAIHFCDLVNHSSEIDINLIHKLNDIYQHEVKNNETLFFSNNISDRLINIYDDINVYQQKISQIPSQNLKMKNVNYTIDYKEKEIEL